MDNPATTPEQRMYLRLIRETRDRASEGGQRITAREQTNIREWFRRINLIEEMQARRSARRRPASSR